MAATSNRSFFINTLVPAYNPKSTLVPTYNPKNKRVHGLLSISCSSSSDKDANSTGGKEMGLSKLAVVTLVAGVLTMGSVQDAMAAKTGGRVGGQAFRSAGPRISSPRINNSRTNIYINPPVTPPLIGGYGYGPYYGGWGWSPFFFAPGPSVGIGVGGGFDFFVLFLVIGAIAAVIRRFRGPIDEDDDNY